MREIKFRAWNKLNGMMYDCYPTKGGLVHWWGHTDGTDAVLMQFTGLHDKVGKGKEIYDSDVLKRGLDGIEGVVTWFGGQWWVTVDGEYDASLHTWVYMNKSCEIIGNKWESNPELLKGESK